MTEQQFEKTVEQLQTLQGTNKRFIIAVEDNEGKTLMCGQSDKDFELTLLNQLVRQTNKK